MLKTIIDLIFPPKCIFCGRLLGINPDIEICRECFESIPFTDSIDTVCEHDSYYDELICVCSYTGIIKDAIINFKFYDKPYFCRALGTLLSEKIKKMTNPPEFDIIISVPLYKKRKKERGYNQAELISKVLGRKFGVPVGANTLARTRNTQSQSLLSRDMRYTNVKNAFNTKNDDKIRNKAVLLVDDVLTTGRTLEECARVLKGAGARKVTAAVIASGRNSLY